MFYYIICGQGCGLTRSSTASFQLCFIVHVVCDLVMLFVYGECLAIQVLHALPDPGALHYCVHTFPENYAGFYHTHNSRHLDMGFETLDLKCGELNI